MARILKTKILRGARLLAGTAAVLFLACGAALAQPAPDAVATSANSRSTVKLTTVLMALPAGTPWLFLRRGWCIYKDVARSASGAREPQNLPPYTATFRVELERAGYKVITGEDNLFDHENSSSDYQVAAVITDARIDGCISMGSVVESGSEGDVKGDGSMKIDWQVYSPIKKQVLAHISTSGSVKLDKSVPGGLQKLILDSFAANARELTSNADFRVAVTASRPLAPDSLVSPGEQTRIALAGSLRATKRAISDAVGSVVTVLTGSGSGSGVLVSADGYLLTNVHVVGDEKSVRVRWSDGIETVAEVVRLARARDIALIKTNARDREPLSIKRGAVTPGQRVYAIGSPAGKQFQGTVSSGIVSANRVIDGLRYIQSDTVISPGSSGGALLEENGSVIGIAVMGYENHGPAGLNMFIPIGDAMDFLNLQQQ